MFEVKIKNYLNKRIIKKLKRKILSKSFEYYRTNAQNSINTMWLNSYLTKIHGSDYKLVNLALNELVAEGKIKVLKEDETEKIITLTDSSISDLSPDILPLKAFVRKYIAHFLSIIAIIISIIALFKK